LILPCAEAGEGFLEVDERFAEVLSKADYILTGSGGTSRPPTDRRQQRRQFGFSDGVPVGLFLGRPQPYRGLDILLEAAQSLDKRDTPGIVAVAGPDKDSIPKHPRLLPLGRVSDVSSLLSAADFVINVNRFCLFDLSTIEAADAGKPMLLHTVGGNKTFRDLGLGCRMLDELTPVAVAAALQAMFALRPIEFEALGRKSLACYESHLTPLAMWNRHLNLYQHAGQELARTN
jgi:glycosyltransferase involved in cell wall biosynthesis